MSVSYAGASVVLNFNDNDRRQPVSKQKYFIINDIHEIYTSKNTHTATLVWVNISSTTRDIVQQNAVYQFLA